MAARAIRLCAATLKDAPVSDTTALVQVKFSTKSFGEDAARVAARAIQNCAATLREADVSDIIAGRPEKEALAALQIISEGLAKAGLTRLDLSDNALGEKGVLACQAAITSQVGCAGYVQSWKLT